MYELEISLQSSKRHPEAQLQISSDINWFDEVSKFYKFSLIKAIARTNSKFSIHQLYLPFCIQVHSRHQARYRGTQSMWPPCRLRRCWGWCLELRASRLWVRIPVVQEFQRLQSSKESINFGIFQFRNLEILEK